MHQAPKLLRPRPPQLPFPAEANQPDLWASLLPEQQQECRQLLGQLLHELSRYQREDQPKEEQR